MRRNAPLLAFVAGWSAMVAALLPFYSPQILGDYVRIAVMGAYAGVVMLVVFVAVHHQAAYRRHSRPMMPPPLVWGMGVSYLLAAGAVALQLYDRLGEPLSYRSGVLALSLGLALCWLVPLARYLQER
jgi:hypothetical protein